MTDGPIVKKRLGFWKIALFTILILGGLSAAFVYWAGFSSNTRSVNGKEYSLLIPRGSDFKYVLSQLEAGHVLKSTTTFKWVSRILKYDNLVKPGRYQIRSGMNNWNLVRKLRSGNQDAVKLSFLSYRTLEELAEGITAGLEMGKEGFLSLLRDPEFLGQYGFDSRTIMSMFIPNTYEVYWTEKPKVLFERMKKEYDRFWNKTRLEKAGKLKFSPLEVSTLASIVQGETYMADERPRVAGLYMNRLRDNIPLQADPTVIFAVGDFTIKRVLNEHLAKDSPYNTYLYAGLPPGPINNPETSSIDAVLNFENHEYYYMVAQCPFTGYHNFSKSLAQHNNYARDYRECIKKLNL